MMRALSPGRFATLWQPHAAAPLSGPTVMPKVSAARNLYCSRSSMADRETGAHAERGVESGRTQPQHARAEDARAEDARAEDAPVEVPAQPTRPTYEPMRMRKPCRIIHVERGARTFHLVGETHGHEGRSTVRWRIQSFSCAAYGDIGAERMANERGLRFARRLPPWFNGASYFANSVGQVVQIEPNDDREILVPSDLDTSD
jgi:hypothetical protein